MKVIVSIHMITASLSATQLAVLGGEGGWEQHRQRLVWGERDRLPAMHRLQRIVSTSFSPKSILRCILRSGFVIGQET